MTTPNPQQPPTDEQVEALYPTLPDDLKDLPPWSDGHEWLGLLSYNKVARFVGEIGLAYMREENARDGSTGDWPRDDWDGLVESSRWACVRAGLKQIATLRSLLAENRRMREALKPFSQFALQATEPGVDDRSVWYSQYGRERIDSWFGPSDFATARAALTPPRATSKETTGD